jgi:hypothetical protein
MKSVNELIFDAVMAAVLTEGGDGWGYIVSKNYLELANEFQQYKDNVWFKIRHGQQNYYSFDNDINGMDQQAIIFTDDEDVEFPNIVVKI